MRKPILFHPGKHLAQILEELEISQNHLAKTIGVSQKHIEDILDKRSPVTAEFALRLSKAFRTTPDFWMNLQNFYDLEVARTSVDVSGIEPIVPPPPDWVVEADAAASGRSRQ